MGLSQIINTGMAVYLRKSLHELEHWVIKIHAIFNLEPSTNYLKPIKMSL